jgi:type II secretory ATPase GspE/PulE/Tfp pilus assembly ATPase PilB-like protein
MPPAQKGKTASRPTSPDAAIKRIEAVLAESALDDITTTVAAQIAQQVGAAAVRVYLRDALTDELYCPVPTNKGLREIRVPPDATSVVGYAAMTNTRALAWMGDLPNRRYVVAVPMAAPDGDMQGVIEMIHATPNVVYDDASIQTFDAIARLVSARIKSVINVQVRSTPYDHLLKARIVNQEQLRDARARASAGGRSVETELLASGIDKAALGKSLSEHFGKPFVENPGALPLAVDLLRRFPAHFLRSSAVLPVALRGKTLEVVVANPRNLTLQDDLSRQLGGVSLALSVGLREDIVAALEFVLGPADAPQAAPAPEPEPEAAPAPAPLVSTSAGSRDWELEEARPMRGNEGVKVDSGTIRLVNETIRTAIETGASDIHWESLDNGGLIIRLRVDGMLHDHQSFKEAVSRPVVSRLKIMAELDIAEHRLPQDGKIRMRDSSGRRTDLRVAVMPTNQGYEDVVLRVLPQQSELPLKDIGMSKENLERFTKAIEQPHGIVLCVGPTGSGKTTTLHAALGHLKNPEVKIWTAEDPVEITQDRVRQVQVHPKIGFTFERALRSFLRLDPDIIMIGEIRDRETADAAIEASLTGHLVLSTLHTNSAPETVTRLLEMGLDPFSFGDALMAVLAQRLVRRLCASCKETYTASPQEVESLRTHYGDPAAFDALNFDRKKLQLAKGKGCAACFKSGYKGRAGIHELLVVSPEIRSIIQKRGEASSIRSAGKLNGMSLLKQDGIRKVMQGITDLHEVMVTCLSD